MSKTPWALILGASSGFGEATALELARTGMNIFGVHMDRRDKLPHVEDIQRRIREAGRETVFFNINASDDDRRADTVEAIRERLAADSPQGTVRVLLHSLAFGALRTLAGAPEVAAKKHLELTCDVMAHSLVMWVQDLLRAGVLENYGRIFAMTSGGSRSAIPQYGAVGAAKAALESYIRQLAMELAPLGITANAIMAGVTDTPALRLIPGHEKLLEFAKQRNPHKRLTRPEDVARTIAILSHPGTYWMTGNVIQVDGGENSVG